MEATKPPKVFLSYSWSSKERAQKDEKLKKMGVYIMRYKWDQVK